MDFHRRHTWVEQAALYILTALSIVFGQYVRLIYRVDPATVDVTQVLDFRQAWFPLTASTVLLLAAGLTFMRESWAARIAFAIGSVSLIYYGVQLCALLLWLAFAVFLPLALLGAVLPPLLLSITTIYSWQAITAHPLSVTQWLLTSNGAARVSRVMLLVAVPVLALHTLISIIVITSAQASAPPPVQESFSVTWRDTSNSRCPTEVTLEFTQHPGYQLWTCSSDLLTYLQSHIATTLSLEVERSYAPPTFRSTIGTWIYRVERMDGWNGTATYAGIMLQCDSTHTACGTQGFPFRQPYRLEPAAP